MRVLILGAGVIGVTTAYELANDGHQITVIDRQSKPAMETSFGNAGLICPGHSFAGTTPKLPGNLMKSLFQKQQVFRYKLHWSPGLIRWGLRFLQQCTGENMKTNTNRKLLLCSYSQTELHDLTAKTGLDYDQKTNGLIYIYRSNKTFNEAKDKLNLLSSLDDKMELLDTSELITIEPALEPTQSKLSGGIYCKTDESGNCFKFTTKLSNLCQKMNVTFNHDEIISRFETKGDKVQKVITNKNEYSADIYVIALGSYSSLFAKQIGDYLPVYPVKGYSITMPIFDVSKAPFHSGIDEDNMLAFSLIGDCIRFTSIAEIAGYNTGFKPSDFSYMVNLAESLFPDAFDFTSIKYWAGLRPMTPNGSPIFGNGKMKNLFYNTGHGHLGWTMACGSAKITADLITGRKPKLSLEGMLLN